MRFSHKMCVVFIMLFQREFAQNVDRAQHPRHRFGSLCVCIYVWMYACIGCCLCKCRDRSMKVFQGVCAYKMRLERDRVDDDGVLKYQNSEVL